jgi:hypothetical protein
MTQTKKGHAISRGILFWKLEFGAWNLFVIWNLGFGI